MSRTVLLGVNIDHVATLRQARYRDLPETCGRSVEPDPVLAAQMAEQAGADGITVHLREDARHIQERDLWRLRECIQTRLNLEMAATPAMLDLALRLRPETICIVPENRAEVTTEGGLEVAGQKERVGDITRAAKAVGIAVSLFIDPDARQIAASSELGADFVELHTGAWARAYHGPARAAELARLVQGAELAHSLGLTVNAGHGINYVNIAEVRTLPHVHELNIGHSIVSRAVFTGVEEAVREMKARMQG